MGKGDKRSRRGKIFAGSYGKTRLKPKKSIVIPEPKPATPAAPSKPEKKPRTAVKVKKTEPVAEPTDSAIENLPTGAAAKPTKSKEAEEAAASIVEEEAAA